MEKLNELTNSHHEIEGVYGDKIIKINTFKVPNNNKIVINIHGTFGSMKGGNNKYLNFAQNLQNEEVANVVLYESSRKNIEIDKNITDRYKQKQAKFIGKTFTDELEDARRVITDSIKNSKELFGINSQDLEITLNGNSLGGILAFYLANEFQQVKNIVSVGTGLRLEIKDVPILDTFPNIEELSKKIELFKGKYVSYFGTEDDVFIRKSFEDLLNLVGSDNSNKSEIEMIGVDHTFGKISGEQSELPYKQIFLGYTALVKEGLMISGGINMITKLSNIKQETILKMNGTLEQSRKDREDLFGW